MAVVQNAYTGDGTTVLYSLSFPYLAQSDVKVSVNGSIVTNYIFATDSSIQFSAAPASGSLIEIYRETDIESTTTTIFPGSAIKAQDLNSNFTQSLYSAQESNFQSSEALSLATTSINTANSAVVTANSAVVTANASNFTAQTAEANSVIAINTANAATTTANNATNAANQANITANASSVASQNAVNTANTAQNTANSALSAANTAVSTANNADATANGIAGTANSALAAATLAQTQANAAYTLADYAVNVASLSFGDLYTISSGSPGSKIIDLGTLSTVACVNNHFVSDGGLSPNYSCALGCATYNFGTV